MPTIGTCNDGHYQQEQPRVHEPVEEGGEVGLVAGEVRVHLARRRGTVQLKVVFRRKLF